MYWIYIEKETELHDVRIGQKHILWVMIWERNTVRSYTLDYERNKHNQSKGDDGHIIRGEAKR